MVKKLANRSGIMTLSGMVRLVTILNFVQSKVLANLVITVTFTAHISLVNITKNFDIV